MINIILQAINRFRSLINFVTVKNVFAAVLVGLILLTSSVSYAATNQPLNPLNRIDSEVFEGNPERPTTTRDWRKEARETEDQPVERVKEIGKETAEAVKDFGKLYPDTAERSAPDALKDS